MGRRAGRRLRPAHAADLHHDRADRDQRAVLAAGRARAPRTCGCCSACSRCSRRSSRSTSRPAAPCCPRLLPLNLLPAANSLNMTVMQAGAIGGPLVAGALIPVFGFPWLYLIDTVTLFADARRRRTPAAAADRGRRPARPGSGRCIDGLRATCARQPVLLMSFVVDIIAMVFGMPRALFPEIAARRLRRARRGRHRVRAAVRRRSRPARSLGGVFSGWVSRVERAGPARSSSAILVWGLAMVGFGVAVGLADRCAHCPMLGGRGADARDRRRRRHGLGGLPHAMLQSRGRRRPCAGGCRASSSSWSPAARAIADVAPRRDRRGDRRRRAAAGGGVLVVVGTVLAALAVPAFVRYRVTRVAA